MIQDIAPKKYSPVYLNSSPQPSDTVFVFGGRNKREHRILVKEENDGSLRFPTAQELYAAGAGEEEIQFLFSIDEKSFYMLRRFCTVEEGILPGADREQKEYSYEAIRLLRRCRPQDMCFAAMTAYHLYDWYQSNRFCGSCGAGTEIYAKERAIRCPSCGNLIFPKICPAVIIGVRNGDQIVASRYADRDYKGVALLAGFCEIGETAEETVAREVMEEVGLCVKNITYYKSQPWGFAGDLLFGYFCDVDGDPTLTVDTTELSYAEWVSREEVSNANNEMSLTGEMIEVFRKGLDK